MILRAIPISLVLAAAIFSSPFPCLADDDPLAGSRPNIVFILADDMGWNQPGFNGGKPGLTPNLDRLADESLKLTQFYTHSVCAPTRAAFLTGRYAFRTWSDWRSEDFGKPSYLKALGLTLAHNEKGEPTRRIHALDSSERTIAEALQESGYYTAITGKWHCGEWLDEHLPMGQGFMHQYGHYAWGIDYYTKTIVHNAPARFAAGGATANYAPVLTQQFPNARSYIASVRERSTRNAHGADQARSWLRGAWHRSATHRCNAALHRRQLLDGAVSLAVRDDCIDCDHANASHEHVSRR